MYHFLTYEGLEAYDARLKQYIESHTGGSEMPATSEDYAAFKSHMQTEIANILTPIEEEEEENE